MERVNVAQAKKIAVTYPDLISFAFSPGWIKTGACVYCEDQAIADR